VNRILFILILSLPHVYGQGNSPEQLRLLNEFQERSYPSDPALASLTNPWGERLPISRTIPADFNPRVAIAARAYAEQGIRFDGYMGSDDDGKHYRSAADGKDNAYFGSAAKKDYNLVQNGRVDDLTERVWVCPDLPIHAVTLAGFPIREAMRADWEEAKDLYTIEGTFPENRPINHWYFRRVVNLRHYLERKQLWSEERISQEEYRDPEARPEVPCQPGDIIIFGHYGDPPGRGGIWAPRHSGIVGSVDSRGMPLKIWNLRVSSRMADNYNGRIAQTRTISGEQVHFEHFLDRYSMIGHGRIVHPFPPVAAPAVPPAELPTSRAELPVPPVQRSIPPVQLPIPRVQLPIPPVQLPIPPVQLPIPPVQLPPRGLLDF